MAKKRVHRPDGSRPIAPPTPTPTPKASPAAPGASARPAAGLRDRFEDASRPMLRRMQALPAFLIPVTLGILLFLGLALSAAWSGILLIIIAVFLFWLTAVSWPVITTGSRILRLAVDVGVLVLGVLKLLGRI
ncbi:MAG TPA: DUF6703 family protein [Motilibacterales bacterium]|nr:DUF6703 family protein [Motilibacterales bacterium]